MGLHYPFVYQLSCTALWCFTRISVLAPTLFGARRSEDWYANEETQCRARQLVN